MSAREMYDYLPIVSPDYTSTTLSITPHGELTFIGRKSQIVHELDDGSITTISISDNAYFDVEIGWDMLSDSDAGTVMDFYFDSNKANAKENSFYWQHPEDGHTYVAKFTSDFTGIYKGGWGNYQQLSGFSMRIFGRKAD